MDGTMKHPHRPLMGREDVVFAVAELDGIEVVLLPVELSFEAEVEAALAVVAVTSDLGQSVCQPAACWQYESEILERRYLQQLALLCPLTSENTFKKHTKSKKPTNQPSC